MSCSVYLKGLCHPRCMCKLMRSTLKSLAQLFQISSESSGGCYIALDVNVNVDRLILKTCLYSTKSDSGCRNQASLRMNTPLGKRPIGLYCACAPADVVPLKKVIEKLYPCAFLPTLVRSGFATKCNPAFYTNLDLPLFASVTQ